MEQIPELTFEKLITNAPKEIYNELKKAGVIILPSHNYEDAFYSGSLDIFDFLNENQINTSIYSTDDEYKELALHSADIWLGTFFIKNFAIPIFCSIIAAYIYDKHQAKKEDKISLKFILEKKDGNTKTVSFDGKVQDLNKVLNAVKKFDNEN